MHQAQFKIKMPPST